MTAVQQDNTPQATGPTGLKALEARLRQDLAWLELPAKAWTLPHELNGQPVLDVAVIGGGMAGLAAATSLKHLGIGAVVFDRSPIGFEGPWATTARMETLRSPKQLTGPALGLPALTFRAGFEAQFGTDAWEVLDKIPRLQWMDYLRWYRHVLQIDVRNEHHVKAIHPRKDGAVELVIDVPGQPTQRVYARRVVLATGRGGAGAAHLGDVVAVGVRWRKLGREGCVRSAAGGWCARRSMLAPSEAAWRGCMAPVILTTDGRKKTRPPATVWTFHGTFVGTGWTVSVSVTVLPSRVFRIISTAYESHFTP